MYVAGRLTEVGVVEDIEKVDAEFEAEGLEYLRVLLGGKVDIREPRTDAGITLDVADAGVNDG